jgi:hypothetical protein
MTTFKIGTLDYPRIAPRDIQRAHQRPARGGRIRRAVDHFGADQCSGLRDRRPRRWTDQDRQMMAEDDYDLHD